jgi:hypothetical protein
MPFYLCHGSADILPIFRPKVHLLLIVVVAALLVIAVVLPVVVLLVTRDIFRIARRLKGKGARHRADGVDVHLTPFIVRLGVRRMSRTGNGLSREMANAAKTGEAHKHITVSKAGGFVSARSEFACMCNAYMPT